jgi:hypothetical protein
MPSYFKNTIFITFLLLFTLRASAPVSEFVIMVRPAPIQPFKSLIYAIGMTETTCDTLAYNSIEEAVGYFQIRPIRLEDYNKRTGSKHILAEMYNYTTAEKIFLYYAYQIGPNNFEQIARNWNGSGPRTYHYWNRVKLYL